MTVVPSPSVSMAVNYNMDNGISSSKTLSSFAPLDGPHYYKFPPYSHGYGSTGGNHYKKDREVRSIGLSVITLLAFLFFLHILQSCVQEQSENFNPQVVIMQAKLKQEQAKISWNKQEQSSLQDGNNDGTFVGHQTVRGKNR